MLWNKIIEGFSATFAGLYWPLLAFAGLYWPLLSFFGFLAFMAYSTKVHLVDLQTIFNSLCWPLQSFFGILAFWNFGILAFWSFGLLAFSVFLVVLTKFTEVNK
jgi:hypothetical protein